jgi:hypothetical protein
VCISIEHVGQNTAYKVYTNSKANMPELKGAYTNSKANMPHHVVFVSKDMVIFTPNKMRRWCVIKGLTHVCGTTSSGYIYLEWRILDIWESRDLGPRT